MRKDQQRCEHCGKWVYQCSLYTLETEVKHPHGVDVAICEPCFKGHSVEYWETWVEKQFPTTKKPEFS